MQVRFHYSNLSKVCLPKGVIVGVLSASAFSSIHAFVTVGFLQIRCSREIYQHCAKDFKRVNLELGGKNKFIILNKIEFNKTVELIRNFTFNSGQNCGAASEVYINQKIFKKFTKNTYK